MDYCGLDLGKTSSRLCVVDRDRNILREQDVATREKALHKAFGRKQKLRVVIEASNNAFWVAELLEELGHELRVVDPNRTKAIGASLIKTDKLDARWLAYLCAAELLATVQVPTREERIGRMPVTARDALIRARTRLINAVRGITTSEGIVVQQCKPERLLQMVEACQDQLPEGMYEALLPLLDGIDALNICIDSGTVALRERASADPALQRLQTIPGVGPITASIYAGAIIDPGRFSSGRDVGAYLGLVPSLYQSGATMRRGRITKRGNRQARWALCMAGNAVLNCKKSTPLVDWAKGLEGRIGRKKAIIATARKLASVMWAVWSKEVEYDARLVA